MATGCRELGTRAGSLGPVLVLFSLGPGSLVGKGPRSLLTTPGLPMAGSGGTPC